MADILHDSNFEEGDYPVIDKGNGVQFHMLPEPLIQLNIELDHPAHAEIKAYVARVLIATGPKADWITGLSAIAAHLGVMLDGSYDSAALTKVAEHCLKQLQAKRTMIIVGGH